MTTAAQLSTVTPNVVSDTRARLLEGPSRVVAHWFRGKARRQRVQKVYHFFLSVFNKRRVDRCGSISAL